MSFVSLSNSSESQIIKNADSNVVPIGAITPLTSDEPIVVASNGSTFLRSGSFETDLSVYPEAPTRLGEFAGTAFYTNIQDLGTTRGGIAWDGTFFWVIAGSTSTAYKYSEAGVYLGVSFSVIESGVPLDIATDGIFFWIVSSTGVYRYVYSNFSYSTTWTVSAQMSGQQGIAYDGTNLWLTDINTDSAYKYNTTGVYQGTFWSTVAVVGGTSANPYGITWDGTHFWIADGNAYKLYRFDAAGVYTGVFSPNPSIGAHRGIAAHNGMLTVIGNSGEATRYFNTPTVGIAAKNDTQTGQPIYLRVK